MKKNILVFYIIISSVVLLAQPPKAFKYQAMVRDNTGDILQNQVVGIRINIHDTTAAGTIVYQETFSETTNQFGLVNLKIGTGTPTIGTFAGINWGYNSKFIETEIDPTGGTSYTSMGTSQLLSVPYSLQSRSLILTDANGNEYNVTVDTEGNLGATMITEWATCGDELFDSRNGKVYGTVQIGSQCWLSENMNIGNMISGADNQLDNGTIEKYCYNDLESNCDTYGGLYQWHEMMQYATIDGILGICPETWHLPTDEEWKQLEGEADSQYNYPDPVWDDTGWRGHDAGKNLKSSYNWSSGGNGTDLFGFTALPGGYRETGGLYYYLTDYAMFWSSTELSGVAAWGRYPATHLNTVYRHNLTSKNWGYSVRCIKD